MMGDLLNKERAEWAARGARQLHLASSSSDSGAEKIPSNFLYPNKAGRLFNLIRLYYYHLGISCNRESTTI